MLITGDQAIFLDKRRREIVQRDIDRRAEAEILLNMATKETEKLANTLLKSLYVEAFEREALNNPTLTFAEFCIAVRYTYQTSRRQIKRAEVYYRAEGTETNGSVHPTG